MSEDEATEATEDTEESSSREGLRKWTKIGAGLAAAIVAVLVSLGVIEGDTGDELTENADCVQRCLSGFEEGDPEFMGPNGEAMLGAPVSDQDVEEAPVEEAPVEEDESP